MSTLLHLTINAKGFMKELQILLLMFYKRGVYSCNQFNVFVKRFTNNLHYLLSCCFI